MKTNLFAIVIAVAAIIIAAAVTFAPRWEIRSTAAAQTLTPSGITVWGDGSVKAAPDIAYVTVGVQTRAATAQEAQRENASAMKNVLAKLEQLGLTKKDLQTSGINIYPVMEKPGTVSGYTVTNNVMVTVHDVSKAGEVFDAAIGAGANTGGNVRFAIKDDSKLRQAALEAAVKAARPKAEAIASALGVKIKDVQSVTEEYGGGPMPLPYAKGAEGMGGTPILPGELTITARVRIVYSY
ncbi:MAG: SIMPL domain-containing protein [Chloroflexi bacterium]|nr:SIMPL domain-containing protein [Chloroflexota bacterium]MCL5074391.1 SIMPL domain-containing protein [Chloroflexota bacterium]